MADATRSQLEQAYRLIQQENLDKAIAILRPITKAEPDNADAWWLLANAVDDPHEAHLALSNVVRLRPNHAEAHDLLQKLNAEFPFLASGASLGTGFSDDDPGFDDIFGASSSTAASSTPASSSFSSNDLDALLNDKYPAKSSGSSSQSNEMFGNDFGGGFDDDFEATGPQFAQDPDLEPGNGKRSKPPKPKREGRPKPVRVTRESPPLDALELERRANRRLNTPMLLAIFLVLIILVGGGLAAAYTLGVFGTPGSGPVAQSPEQQALVSSITATNSQLASIGFKGPQTAVVPTTLGNTFTVQVCGAGGPNLQSNVYKVMDIVATTAARIQDQIKGVGLQFTNCSNTATYLYRATAPIDAVVAYVNGGMTDKKTFHASWTKS